MEWNIQRVVNELQNVKAVNEKLLVSVGEVEITANVPAPRLEAYFIRAIQVLYDRGARDILFLPSLPRLDECMR